MSERRWLARALASAVIVLAPPLSAQTLEWEAPEGCPQAEDVRARLERALGREGGDLGSISRVRGSVVAEADGYRLTLELVDSGQRSSRSLRSSDCDDLAGAAALAIALAVHAGAEHAHADAAAGPVEGREARDVAGRAERAQDQGIASQDAARPAPAPQWSAGASAVLDVGALPEPALGFGVFGRVGWGALELDVHGMLLPSQQLGVGTDEAVELGLAAAGLRTCLRRSTQALLLGACVGAEVGLFSATGQGLEPERDLRDLWLAAGPAVLARSAFAGPLQLEVLVEPLLSLVRKSYAVDATDIVHTPSLFDLRVVAMLSIGLGDGQR